MTTVIQACGTNSYSIYDSYIANDPTWKTIGLVAVAIFSAIASFYISSLAGCILTFSAAIITFSAFSKEAPEDKATRLLDKAEASEKNRDLNQAIQYCNQAIGLQFENKLLKAKVYTLLAKIYLDRKKENDVSLATLSFQRARSLKFNNDHFRSIILYSLSLRLALRGQDGDLEEAIQCCREGIGLDFHDDLLKEKLLNRLNLFLVGRNRDGDLDAAIQYTRNRARDAHTQDRMYYAILLCKIGTSLAHRNEKDLAIEYFRRALAIPFQKNRFRAKVLLSFAEIYWMRNAGTDRVNAQELLQQALALEFRNSNLRIKIQNQLTAWQSG